MSKEWIFEAENTFLGDHCLKKNIKVHGELVKTKKCYTKVILQVKTLAHVQCNSITLLFDKDYWQEEQVREIMDGDFFNIAISPKILPKEKESRQKDVLEWLDSKNESNKKFSKNLQDKESIEKIKELRAKAKEEKEAKEREKEEKEKAEVEKKQQEKAMFSAMNEDEKKLVLEAKEMEEGYDELQETSPLEPIKMKAESEEFDDQDFDNEFEDPDLFDDEKAQEEIEKEGIEEDLNFSKKVGDEFEAQLKPTTKTAKKPKKARKK